MEPICYDSGKLPSKYCNNLGEEFFIKGTVPEKKCVECRDGYKDYDLDEKKIEDLLNKQREEKREDMKINEYKGLKLKKRKLKLH